MNHRWTKTFSSAADFSNDLGSTGAWVGPRTGDSKRTQGQKEDYLIRRLLVAWRRKNNLPFPFTIFAADNEPKQPDFVLTDSRNRKIGIEVTEAGTEEWQEELTQLEQCQKEGKYVAEKVSPYDSPKTAIEEIRTAIEGKTKKAEKGWYQDCPCDLLVYDNTSSFERITKKDVPDIGASGLQTPFRQVHLISGNFVYTDVLGDEPKDIDVSQDYNIDFAEWIGGQVELLHDRKFGQLDIEAIMEELTALAISDRRALRSHLKVLLIHLLKWKYQPSHRNRSWKDSIGNARDEIEDLLADSPSLKKELGDEAPDMESGLNRSYGRARKVASNQTELDIETFPESCPFAVEDILNEDFFP